MRRVLVVAAFLALPFFLLGSGYSLLFEAPEVEHRRETERRLEIALDQLTAEKEPLTYLSRTFRVIEKRVFSASHPLNLWKEVAAALQRRFPGMLAVVVVDGEGKPVPEFCDRPAPKQLLQRFFRGYRALLREKRPLDSIAGGFARSFLGEGIPTDQEFHGRFFQRSAARKSQFVYMSAPWEGGMFFVFLNPPESIRDLVVSDRISRFNLRERGIRVTAAKSHDRVGRILRILGVRPAGGTKVWSRLQNSISGQCWFGATLMGRRLMYPNWWVVGATSLPPLKKQPLEPGMVWGLLGLAWTGIVFLQTRGGTGIEAFLGSVRVKLVGAFLYTALVPLLVMGLTVQSFLADRKEVLTEDFHERTERVLVNLDQSFEKFTRKIARILMRYRYPKGTRGVETLEGLLRSFPKIRQDIQCDWCQVFDATGKTAFAYSDPNSSILPGNPQKLLRKVAIDYLGRCSIASVPVFAPHASGELPSDVSIDSVLSLLEFSDPDCLEVQFGASRLFLAPFLLSDQSFHGSHMAFFLWNTKRLQWNYLQRELPKLARKTEGGRFLVWPDGDDSQCFPPDFKHLQGIRPLLPKVTTGIRAFRQIVANDGDPLIITGLRGSRISHFSFLCVNTMHGINAVIAGQVWTFRFIALAILGVCAVIGAFLARLFIIPVKHLNAGMEALIRRDFEFRLPVDSADELGQLAGYFNTTLEGLKDLEVAKTVQESFFPAAPLTAGGWELFGSCIPASEIGGDYFDYFPIGGDRVLFVVGDVSGHGVGAALVVAMTKALIDHPSAAGSPPDLLKSINHSLYRILGRKKMMSSLISAFSPAIGQWEFGNAGQTFPVLIREGTARFVEQPGYPLGSTKNWKVNSRVVALKPGDTLILYTDGIVEAASLTGIPVGYDRLLTDLPQLVRETARDTEQAIREWHHLLAPLLPPADDMTLLVVQENKSLNRSVET